MTSSPERLEASIGNGLEGYYVVRLAEDGSLVWSFEGGEPATLSEAVAPDAAAWERFALLLGRLGVFSWQPEYRNNAINDGTYWAFVCNWGDLSVNATGANVYPPGFGEFCAGIEALLGGDLTFR